MQRGRSPADGLRAPAPSWAAASRCLQRDSCCRRSRALPGRNCTVYSPGQDESAGPLLKNDQEFQTSRSRASRQGQDPCKCGTPTPGPHVEDASPGPALPSAILPFPRRENGGCPESEQLPKTTRLAVGREDRTPTCAAPGPRDLNLNKPLPGPTCRQAPRSPRMTPPAFPCQSVLLFHLEV